MKKSNKNNKKNSSNEEDFWDDSDYSQEEEEEDSSDEIGRDSDSDEEGFQYVPPEQWGSELRQKFEEVKNKMKEDYEKSLRKIEKRPRYVPIMTFTPEEIEAYKYDKKHPAEVKKRHEEMFKQVISQIRTNMSGETDFTEIDLLENVRDIVKENKIEKSDVHTLNENECIYWLRKYGYGKIPNTLEDLRNEVRKVRRSRDVLLEFAMLCVKARLDIPTCVSFVHFIQDVFKVASNLTRNQKKLVIVDPYVNDKAMNVFINGINEIEKSFNNPKWDNLLILDSTFIENIRTFKKYKVPEFFGVPQKEAREFKEKFKNDCRIMLEPYRNEPYPKIVMPLYIEGFSDDDPCYCECEPCPCQVGHWVCLIVNFSKNLIEIYDSKLDFDSHEIIKNVMLLINWVETEFPKHKGKFTIKEVKWPEQFETTTSGWFTLLAACALRDEFRDDSWACETLECIQKEAAIMIGKP